MYKYNDLTGKKYGRLTVISESGRTSDRHILWKCRCDCGNTALVSSRDLTRGHTRSCGCLQKDVTRQARYKHGDRDKRLYQVWKGMKTRCERLTCKSYRWYGAKGVRVCKEWHDYATFKEWALQNGYDETAPYQECTIDRINPYGNYEPSNCRWVSMAVQSMNKRAKAHI